MPSPCTTWQRHGLILRLYRQLGIDMHELNAIITLIAANTGKSGGEIGRALRFAFSRASTPQVVGAFRTIAGVDIYEPATGTMRDFGDVLMEVAEQWDRFSDAEKNAIARSIGGTRHINDMIILFENLGGMGVKVLRDSINSFGSAAAENEKYVQSLERRIQSLATSAKELALALGDAGLVDMMQTMIDLGQGVLGAFNSLPPLLKQMVVAMATAKLAGAGLAKVFPEIAPRDVARSVSQMVVQFMTLQKSAGGLTVTLTGLKSVLLGLKGAVVGFLGPWGILVASVLAGATIFQWVKKRMEESSDAALKQASAAMKASEAARQQYNTLLEVQGIVADIEAGNLTSAEVATKQEEAWKKFNSVFPGLISNLDSIETRYAKIKERIDGLTDAQLKLANSMELASDKAKEVAVKDLTASIKDTEEQLQELRHAYDTAIDMIASMSQEEMERPSNWARVIFEIRRLATSQYSGLKWVPGELEVLFLSTKEMLSGSDAVLSDWRNTTLRYLSEIQQAVIDLEANLQSLDQELGILEGRFQEAWKQSGSDSEYSHFERIGERARALEEYLSSTVELFENTLTFRTLASEVSGLLII